MSALKCIICGQSLTAGDMTSDPSQHICVELNGTNITEADADHAGETNSSTSDESSPSQEAPGTLPVQAAAMPVLAHSKDDLAEIGRLHMENQALKSQLTHTFADVDTAGAAAAARGLAPVNGESVIVELTVNAKKV